MTAKAVLKFADVGSIFLTCAGPGPVDDAQWREFAKDLERKPVNKYIGAVIGSVEVSSIQRKLIVDILRVRKITSVIVTDDSLVRGMVTAASWLGANIRGVNWGDLQRVVDELEPDRANAERIMSLMTSFKIACTPRK